MDPSHLTRNHRSAARCADQGAPLRPHEVDVEHLLLALLDQSEGIVPRLLSQAGSDPDRLRARWRPSWAAAPGQRTGREPGPDQRHPATGRLLDSAEQERAGSKDEYVSVEHLVLAMLAEGPSTVAGRLLREQR